AALVSANTNRTAPQAEALHDARFQHLKEQKAEQAAQGAALVSSNADRTASQAEALHDARFQHLKEQKAEQAAQGAALVSANVERTSPQAEALHDARFQHLKEQKAEQAAQGAALVSANADRTASQAEALHDARFQHLKEQKAEQAAHGAALVSANVDRTASQHVDSFAVQGRVAEQEQAARDVAQDAAIHQTLVNRDNITRNAESIKATSNAVEGNTKQLEIMNGDRVQGMLQARQEAEINAAAVPETKGRSTETKANRKEIERSKKDIRNLKIDSVTYSDSIAVLTKNQDEIQASANANHTENRATQSQVDRNTQQMSKLNNSFSTLKSQVDSDRDEYRSGIATATALAGLPQVNANQTFMVSAAAGTFKDASAIAVGGSANVTEHVVVKFGMSDSTENDVAANVGVGYGF
ncbi:YadA-like family protein, partial [Kluyvera intermedia]|uniref:YadA-like family protein n=1 Tax=Kluyvera intermedia TaxID=61648 RepID=UPI00352589D0